MTTKIITVPAKDVETTTIVPRKKSTLHDILNILDRRDDDEIWDAFDESVAEELGNMTRDKIEGYHEIIEALEDDAARLKARADLFKKFAQTQENKAKRIENKLRFTMRTHGCLKLPGHDHIAVTGKRKHLEIKEPKIDLETFIRFGSYVDVNLVWKGDPTWQDAELFPEKVERKFTWNKDALRQAFKDGTAPDDLRAFATYDEQETFKWDVLRKI